MTATTGDAEVLYALRPAAVGNDNWVSYGYQHGKWKVTGCQYPIGDDPCRHRPVPGSSISSAQSRPIGASSSVVLRSPRSVQRGA